jgi:hypothetical protein
MNDFFNLGSVLTLRGLQNNQLVEYHWQSLLGYLMVSRAVPYLGHFPDDKFSKRPPGKQGLRNRNMLSRLHSVALWWLIYSC